MTSIHGWTADGFEGVRDAFTANFERGEEVGAAFSAYHRGQKVADLWGGLADQDAGTPWEEDTLALVYSTTKGMTAICAHQLADAGHLDIDALASEYWPEFAVNGKDQISVDHLLSHRAGLAWLDTPMTLDEVLAWEPVVRALEKQEPSWEPGSKHGYHATTYGWLVGEIIRRVSGRTVGQQLRSEVAEPLGLDTWIGLPAEHESRVATLVSEGFDMSLDALGDPENNPLVAMLAPFIGEDGVLTKALTAPQGAFADPEVWNSQALHAAEIPAANGITDARSLARMYSACVNEVDGIRLLSPDQLADAITQRTSGPNSILMNMDIQFGLGFMLRSSLLPLGGPRSFGHFGAGGSVGWADPDAELAFGYAMNKMSMGLAGDLRSTNLVNACYDAIA